MHLDRRTARILFSLVLPIISAGVLQSGWEEGEPFESQRLTTTTTRRTTTARTENEDDHDHRNKLASRIKEKFDAFRDSLGREERRPRPREPTLREQLLRTPLVLMVKLPEGALPPSRAKSLSENKEVRAADEAPSRVRSGFLRPEQQPLPLRLPPRSGISILDTQSSRPTRPGLIRQPGVVDGNIRLLQARLGPGVVAPTFDPSIVVNFLRLVAAQRPLDDRNRFSRYEDLSIHRLNMDSGMAGHHQQVDNALEQEHTESAFGPFSFGNDTSAGTNPSSIVTPELQLQGNLYSFLLPRLETLAPLTNTISGVPGLDYPILSIVPYTNFQCYNMPWPGLYADTEARCQAWHLCDLDGRQATFLCPNGTIFNQAFFTCDWWYNVDCTSAVSLYYLNDRLFSLPKIDDTKPHRILTQEILDTIFV